MFSSDSDKKGRLGPKFNALFKVDVKRAIEDGFEFWVAGNGVILCERTIPPGYLHCTYLEVRDNAVVEPDWNTDPYYSTP
jgi:RNA:NAD 2'-phosphotransferase (TPT1/KptA family)